MRGSAGSFDDSVSMLLDLGVPDHAIDEVLDECSICCSPYGEGPCSEESASQLKAAAEKYDNPADREWPTFSPMPVAEETI